MHLAHCLHPNRYHHYRADDHVDDDHDGGTDDNHHDHCCSDDHDNHDYPAANDDHHHYDNAGADDHDAGADHHHYDHYQHNYDSAAHDYDDAGADDHDHDAGADHDNHHSGSDHHDHHDRMPHRGVQRDLLPAAPEHLPRQWELRRDVHPRLQYLLCRMHLPVRERRVPLLRPATSHRLHCTPGLHEQQPMPKRPLLLAVPVPRNKRPQTGLRPRLRRDLAGSKAVSTRMPTTTTTGAWLR